MCNGIGLSMKFLINIIRIDNRRIDSVLRPYHQLSSHFSLCIRDAFFKPAESIVAARSVSSRVGNEETNIKLRLPYCGRALLY